MSNNETSKSPAAQDKRRFIQTVDSPLLRTTPEGMSFAEAIGDVIDGSRITKAEWDDPNIYLQLKGEYLVIHKDDGDHAILLREADLIGTDWIVLDDDEE